MLLWWDDMAANYLEQLYAQRLSRMTSDALFVELTEARTAGAASAVVALEEELAIRGICTDQSASAPVE